MRYERQAEPFAVQLADFIAKPKRLEITGQRLDRLEEEAASNYKLAFVKS